MIDKLLHAETTALIVIAGAIIHPLFGIALAVIASAGKELYDWFKYGKEIGWAKFKPMMVKDFVADLAGILIGGTIWKLLTVL
jgi:ABC-type microcin C transport system permease subunit YejB